VGRLGINYYRIDANADPSRFSTTIAPKFCIGAHSAIAHPLCGTSRLRLSDLARREFENLANPT